MDIIAHGLWAGLAAKTANKRKLTKKPLKIRWFIFWSIIPDIFTFTIVLSWFCASVLMGNMSLSNLPHYQVAEPVPPDTPFIFNLTNTLYNISHSLFVFVAVFVLVAWRKKGSAWAMTGWLMHILIDIPTHSYKYFPTPFLWPISQYKFDGWGWSEPWFMFLNYALIILVYVYLYRRWLKNN